MSDKETDQDTAINALRLAFQDCGYDFDGIMSSRVRAREYADLRAVAWSIYQRATGLTYLQIAPVFQRHKATIWSAFKRMDSLYKWSKDFRRLADRINERYLYHTNNTDNN